MILLLTMLATVFCTVSMVWLALDRRRREQLRVVRVRHHQDQHPGRPSRRD